MPLLPVLDEKYDFAKVDSSLPFRRMSMRDRETPKNLTDTALMSTMMSG